VIQLHPEDMFKKLLTIIFVGVSLFAPTDDDKSRHKGDVNPVSTNHSTPPPSLSYIEPKLNQ
jgi:hypothetical protein